ncbi:MAG: hypothetical protein N2422_05005 [Rhodobacteraceae bacterium]|nr:hypothetical protein [Paracoccaceae bacterium]
MRIVRIGAVMAVAVLAAGCEGQSQMDRALMGGLTGALLGDATHNDVGTSAAVGALAGMVSCGVQGLPPCS